MPDLFSLIADLYDHPHPGPKLYELHEEHGEEAFYQVHKAALARKDQDDPALKRYLWVVEAANKWHQRAYPRPWFEVVWYKDGKSDRVEPLW